MKNEYTDKALPFGQYKGVLICDAPTDFLNWLLEQEWFSKKFKDLVPLVEKELKYRLDWDLKL